MLSLYLALHKIILMYDMCALVEAKGFKMMTMEMFGSSFVSVVHDRVLEMSSFYLALFKDHFDV